LIAIVPTYLLTYLLTYIIRKPSTVVHQGKGREGWVRATHPSGPDPRSLTAVEQVGGVFQPASSQEKVTSYNLLQQQQQQQLLLLLLLL
jgi:hypothetical protein